MQKRHVDGEKKGNILIYTLSTCGWCKKVKQLLNELSVEYDFIDVDELSGEDKEEVMKQVRTHNPQSSFPTILVNDTCIVGFKEDKIREVLGK